MVAGGKDGEHLAVATTRPETILGDTAVCVHPEVYNTATVFAVLASPWRVRRPLSSCCRWVGGHNHSR